MLYVFALLKKQKLNRCFYMKCHASEKDKNVILDESDISKNSDLSKLSHFLNESCECYVLITCSKPSSEGKMQVEMTYEGDAILASYLIESANSLMDQDQALHSYS
jgi:hypothetical protein